MFDLYLLLASGADPGLEGFKLSHRLDEAVANAKSVTYDMFKGQVFSYLHADHQAQYASEAALDGMVLRVVGALEEASR